MFGGNPANIAASGASNQTERDARAAPKHCEGCVSRSSLSGYQHGRRMGWCTGATSGTRPAPPDGGRGSRELSPAWPASVLPE